MKRWGRLLLLCVVFFTFSVDGLSEGLTDNELQALDFRQYPGRRLPLDLPFVDETGRTVVLGDFFNETGQPVIVVPGYFRCRTLCSGITDGLLHALQGSQKNVGGEFRVLYVSIDPEEKISEAKERKAVWLRRYGRVGIRHDACHFLRGSAGSIAIFAQQIGFEYRYDPPTGEYAHLAGFLVVRPDGRISRYFFGVNFSSGELDRALDRAARMQSGSAIKEFLLLCFHYNPIRSRYGAAIIWTVRILALATIAGLAWLVLRSKPENQPAATKEDRHGPANNRSLP